MKNYFRCYDRLPIDTTTYFGFYITAVLQTMTGFAFFLLFLSLAELQVNLCSYADACLCDFIGLCDDVNKHVVDITINRHNRSENNGANIQIKRLIKDAIELHKDLIK